MLNTMSNFFKEKEKSIEEQLIEMGYNLDELKPILDTNKTSLIISGAGSGKTTALILKILSDLKNHRLEVEKELNGEIFKEQGKIWVSTFLKTGAEELETEFKKWANLLGINHYNLDKIKFSTIHSEVYSALKDFQMNITIEENTEQEIKNQMKRLKITPIVNLDVEEQITIENARDMTALMSYVRNVLDENKYNHSVMAEYNITPEKVDSLIKSLKASRQAKGVMDFEDMQELLLEAIKKKPELAEVVGKRYDYIYMDEFQDVSQLQYELLKTTYFKYAKRILCIGDDDQCIYGWRGSDIDIITRRFKEDFKPETYQLTMNYRCASNILEAIKPSIELNTRRTPKPLRAFNQGGELIIIQDKGIQELLTRVNADIENGLKVGILARTNGDLIIPTMLLDLEGNFDTTFHISKGISLSRGFPKQAIDLMGVVLDRLTPETERLLKTLVKKSDIYQVNKFIDFLNANPDINIKEVNLEDIEYSTPALLEPLKILRKNISDKEKYIELLEYQLKEVYTTESVYTTRAKNFIYYLKKVIMEHPIIKEQNLENIQKLFTQTIPQRWSLRQETIENPDIKITTVHDAKGKEWDSVYVWNAVLGTFPSIRANKKVSIEELEEERRVNYIAWTRAKKKLTVFTRTDIDQGFIKEANLEKAKII